MEIRSINLFDPDINHIPEYNYQKFQRCLLLESGIGSTVQDAFMRVDSISTFITHNRVEDLDNEITNLKLALFSGIEGLSYKSMAFACLVQNIDGKTYPIKTDNDIHNLSQTIAETGITHGEVTAYVEDVKKKLIFN